MANKTIITRIKNKVDNLSAWQSYTGTLLDGEIAIVRVPTGQTYTNPVTGKSEPVVELLMKVGDGSSTFANLPWLSAKASDVYNWAKLEDPSTITVKYIKGTETRSSTLADVLKDLETAEEAISGLQAGVANVRSLISVDPASAGDGVVHGITYDNTTGKFSVSYGLVQTADIADSAVTTAKIKDANVTAAKLAADAVETAKIKDGAVTNTKLGSDISSDKINIDSSKTLTTKIGEMDADILIAKTHANAPHDYLPSNTNYAGSASKGGPANSVANKLSIQLNGGAATEFDGSTAQAINITRDSIGAASQADVFGADGNGGLKGEVLKNAADILKNAGDIKSIQEAIANGVDFIGVTTTDVSTTTNNTNKSVTINNETVEAVKGDIVIYGTREFIWDGSKWEVLGDATRIGNLEQKVDGLNYTTVVDGAATNNKFVTSVTQEKGQIAVTYARPTATDVSYGTSNVSDALNALEANKSGIDHTHIITAGAEDDDVVVLTGTPGTLGVGYKAEHANSGVTAGTYTKVTVDVKGHITGGTNPTTLAGYGITDAYTTDDVYTKNDVYTKGETDAELIKKADKADTYTKTEVNTAISTAKTEAATDASNKVAVALSEAQTYANGLNSAMDARVDVLEDAKGKFEAEFTAVKSNYVRYTQIGTTDTYQMHLGTDTDVIIFDCGGAE